MTHWTLLTIVVGFLVLPGVLAVQSWRKLRRIGWEWIAFGLWAMSIYIAIANVWMLPGMRDLIGDLPFTDFINRFMYSGFEILAVFIGPVAFFMAWDAVEEPAISEPQNWRILRSAAAAVALVLFFTPAALAAIGTGVGFWGNAYSVTFIVPLILFVISQIKLSMGRQLDVDRIVNDELKRILSENKEERKSSIQRLGKVAKQSAKARETIILALGDPEHGVVVSALEQIGSCFGPMAHDAVPKLVSLIRSEEPTGIERQLQSVLVSICEVDFGSDSEKWLSWWHNRENAQGGPCSTSLRKSRDSEIPGEAPTAAEGVGDGILGASSDVDTAQDSFDEHGHRDEIERTQKEWQAGKLSHGSSKLVELAKKKHSEYTELLNREAIAFAFERSPLQEGEFLVLASGEPYCRSFVLTNKNVHFFRLKKGSRKAAEPVSVALEDIHELTPKRALILYPRVTITLKSGVTIEVKTLSADSFEGFMESIEKLIEASGRSSFEM